MALNFCNPAEAFGTGNSKYNCKGMKCVDLQTAVLSSERAFDCTVTLSVKITSTGMLSGRGGLGFGEQTQ